MAALPDVVVPERRSVTALRHVKMEAGAQRTEYVAVKQSVSGGNTRNGNDASSTENAHPSAGATDAGRSGSTTSGAEGCPSAAHAQPSSSKADEEHQRVYKVRPPSARSRLIQSQNDDVDIAFRFGKGVSVGDTPGGDSSTADSNSNSNGLASASAGSTSDGHSKRDAAVVNEEVPRVEVGIVARGTGGWPPVLRSPVLLGLYRDL